MDKERELYIRQLEETIWKFIKPIKDIPFPIVIKALTRHEVLKFNKIKDKKMIDLLVKAAENAGINAAEKGIIADRPNEAGNRIEPFVRDSLNKIGFQAGTPVTQNGKRQAAGYPDIELSHNNGWNAYLDCKTYAIKSKG